MIITIKVLKNAVVEFNEIHGQQNCRKISIMPVKNNMIIILHKVFY